MFIIFGWRETPDLRGEWLLPCDACDGVEYHWAYHMTRWLTFFFIPLIPFGGGRFVKCSRCGRRRSITRDEEDQLEKIASGLSALGRLQELAPETAERIAWEVERGWIALPDLRERVQRELDKELSVEGAERRLKEGGHFPRL